MPSFDAGFYHLTALIPILEDEGAGAAWCWQQRPCSVVHSLRELLDSLRSVDVADLPGEDAEPGRVARPIPFSADARTHFARLLVVEDLAYNGLQRGDTLLDLLRASLPHRRPQRSLAVDHLPCRYLLVLLDFDAPAGDRATVAQYLQGLWQSMEQEWTLILRHCRGFELEPHRRQRSFVELILRHEIESTFSFSAYPAATAQARGFQPETGRFTAPRSADRPLLFAGAIAWPLLLVLLALLVIGALLQQLRHPDPAVLLLPLALLGAALLLTPLLWQGLLRHAQRPWPAQPGTDLPAVLKALDLQQRLLRFAEDWQNRAPEPSVSLRQAFRQFLQEARPHDLAAPTQRPGQIASIRPPRRP